jgi:hypothetical protein
VFKLAVAIVTLSVLWLGFCLGAVYSVWFPDSWHFYQEMVPKTVDLGIKKLDAPGVATIPSKPFVEEPKRGQGIAPFPSSTVSSLPAPTMSPPPLGPSPNRIRIR